MGPLAFILVGGLLYFQVDGKLANNVFPQNSSYLFKDTFLKKKKSFFKKKKIESCPVGLQAEKWKSNPLIPRVFTTNK